ncbi:hypothetical protein N9L02_02275 [Gammaproteobacteria bacterium]|nr:hypothetical protein [Gammaproteobacteria bacterium]
MVDEREDQYEDEEGEYHFSDDGVNYGESETPKPTKNNIEYIKKIIVDKLSNLTSAHRMIVAGLIFFVLVGVIYKMLLPASSAVSTDIADITTKNTKPQQVAAQNTSASPKEVVKLKNVSQQPVANIQKTSIAATTSEEAELAPKNTQPARIPETQDNPNNDQDILQGLASKNSSPKYNATESSNMSNVSARVKAVEDNNIAMMNLLQTEYAQKFSDFDMQSNLVRNKIDEMSKRINRMESNLEQITKLLKQSASRSNKQQTGRLESVMLAQGTSSRVPKNIYSVQAIIPGRAWLKADSGDTVTVAEGDTLRDYGRVNKIDPYDGVVEIDTGNKIIALSYGVNSE